MFGLLKNTPLHIIPDILGNDPFGKEKNKRLYKRYNKAIQSYKKSYQKALDAGYTWQELKKLGYDPPLPPMALAGGKGGGGLIPVFDGPLSILPSPVDPLPPPSSESKEIEDDSKEIEDLLNTPEKRTRPVQPNAPKPNRYKSRIDEILEKENLTNEDFDELERLQDEEADEIFGEQKGDDDRDLDQMLEPEELDLEGLRRRARDLFEGVDVDETLRKEFEKKHDNPPDGEPYDVDEILRKKYEEIKNQPLPRLPEPEPEKPRPERKISQTVNRRGVSGNVGVSVVKDIVERAMRYKNSILRLNPVDAKYYDKAFKLKREKVNRKLKTKGGKNRKIKKQGDQVDVFRRLTNDNPDFIQKLVDILNTYGFDFTDVSTGKKGKKERDKIFNDWLSKNADEAERINYELAKAIKQEARQQEAPKWMIDSIDDSRIDTRVKNPEMNPSIKDDTVLRVLLGKMSSELKTLGISQQDADYMALRFIEGMQQKELENIEEKGDVKEGVNTTINETLDEFNRVMEEARTRLNRFNINPSKLTELMMNAFNIFQQERGQRRGFMEKIQVFKNLIDQVVTQVERTSSSSSGIEPIPTAQDTPDELATKILEDLKEDVASFRGARIAMVENTGLPEIGELVDVDLGRPPDGDPDDDPDDSDDDGGGGDPDDPPDNDPLVDFYYRGRRRRVSLRTLIKAMIIAGVSAGTIYKVYERLKNQGEYNGDDDNGDDDNGDDDDEEKNKGDNIEEKEDMWSDGVYFDPNDIMMPVPVPPVQSPQLKKLRAVYTETLQKFYDAKNTGASEKELKKIYDRLKKVIKEMEDAKSQPPSEFPPPPNPPEPEPSYPPPAYPELPPPPYPDKKTPVQEGTQLKILRVVYKKMLQEYYDAKNAGESIEKLKNIYDNIKALVKKMEYVKAQYVKSKKPVPPEDEEDMIGDINPNDIMMPVPTSATDWNVPPPSTDATTVEGQLKIMRIVYIKTLQEFYDAKNTGASKEELKKIYDRVKALVKKMEYVKSQQPQKEQPVPPEPEDEVRPDPQQEEDGDNEANGEVPVPPMGGNGDDPDTLVSFGDTDQSFLPDVVDPAEANLFLSTRKEAEEEQRRWAKYSLVRPGFGLGNINQNPLAMHNYQEEKKRFTNCYANPKPAKNITKQQVEKKWNPNMQPYWYPAIQTEYGNVQFEDAFYNEKMGQAFTNPDPVNNLRQTWENPNSIYHPENSLAGYTCPPVKIPELRNYGGYYGVNLPPSTQAGYCGNQKVKDTMYKYSPMMENDNFHHSKKDMTYELPRTGSARIF